MLKPTVMTLRIGDIDVDKINGVVSWRSGMAIDCDGSPRAYHPDSALGLDRLANAWNDKSKKWVGLVCDSDGKPVVQGPSDPAPGFYVSPVALRDRTKPADDASSYVDADAVPYISVPTELLQHFGVRMGDLAWVTHGDREWGAIVADVGPRGKLGEASPALARALGIPSDARHGGLSEPVVSWRVFCASAGTPPWPRGDVNALAMATKAVRDAG